MGVGGTSEEGAGGRDVEDVRQAGLVAQVTLEEETRMPRVTSGLWLVSWCPSLESRPLGDHVCAGSVGLQMRTSESDALSLCGGSQVEIIIGPEGSVPKLCGEVCPWALQLGISGGVTGCLPLPAESASHYRHRINFQLPAPFDPGVL